MSRVFVPTSDESVKSIIRHTFPNFNGKQVTVVVTDCVEFYGTQWDAGNRRQYKILRLEDSTLVKTIPEAPFLQHSQAHEAQIKLPPGFVVVVFVHAGTKTLLEIHCAPSNVTPTLEQKTELTRAQEVVLLATRKYKNSYGGRTNIRFEEANRYVKISQTVWNTAISQLQVLKLLDGRGALTISGRNAANQLPMDLEYTHEVISDDSSKRT